MKINNIQHPYAEILKRLGIWKKYLNNVRDTMRLNDCEPIHIMVTRYMLQPSFEEFIHISFNIKNSIEGLSFWELILTKRERNNNLIRH